MRISNVNGRPTENAFHNAFFGVNIDAHGRCDLMIGTTISFYVDESFFRDIVHIPSDLVSMSLNDHFILGFRIDHAHNRTIYVREVAVDIGSQIV